MVIFRELAREAISTTVSAVEPILIQGVLHLHAVLILPVSVIAGNGVVGTVELNELSEVHTELQPISFLKVVIVDVNQIICIIHGQGKSIKGKIK